MVRKEIEKKEKKTYLYLCAHKCRQVAELARLKGQGMVERWGFEDLACGEKRSL